MSPPSRAATRPTAFAARGCELWAVSQRPVRVKSQAEGDNTMTNISDDFVLIDVPGMLNFSKRRSHREQTLATYTTLCQFLQKNALVTRNIIESNQQVSDGLQVRRKDLNDEGYVFFCEAEQKWLKAIDRGGSPTDTTILEAALRKIRQPT